MRYLLRYMRPFAVQAVVALLLVLAHTVADLALPRLMASIVDGGVVAGDSTHIIRVGLLMLAVTVFGSVSAICAAFFAARTANGFARDLRLSVFKKVQAFSLSEFDRLGTSTLITRSTNDVLQTQNFVQIGLHMLARAPLMCVGSVALALSTDLWLSRILLVALPFIALAIVFVAKVGVPLFRKMQVKMDAVNLVLREALGGVRVIRAFDRTESERRRFDAANRDLTETALNAQRVLLVLMPLLTLLMNITTVAVMWFGSIRVNLGALQIGELIAFVQYATHILFSLMILSSLFVIYPRAAVSATRLREVLETPSSVRDPEGQDIELLSAEGPLDSPLLEFRGVSFRYPGADVPALDGVSFSIEAGQTTAIIGGTGSGKSTIAALIERFYDASEGALLLHGRDVRALSQRDLRSRLSLVPQRANLFSGSIAENLRFGAPQATDEELREAASIAQATEILDERPGGLAEEVSRGGVNFSGGQKQRLAIARALARDAELYIFDDSFSALDFRTDARLRAALRQELAREAREARKARETRGSPKAVLLIAQRIGTVMTADKIIVLDEGRLVGCGTHQELLASCEVYKQIAASQLDAEGLNGGEAV